MMWSFYIEDREINVTDVNALKITEAFESKFKNRAQFGGDIILYGQDYTYMKTLENDRRYEKFSFRAEQNGNVRYKGSFIIPDVFFDTDKLTATFSPTLDDDYALINNNSRKDVNCLDGLTTTKISVKRYSYIAYSSGIYRKDNSDEPANHSKVWEDSEALNYPNAAFYEGIYRVYAQERIVASKFFDRTHDGWTEVDDIDTKISLWGRIPSSIAIPDSSEIFTTAHKYKVAGNEDGNILESIRIGTAFNEGYTDDIADLDLNYDASLDTNVNTLKGRGNWQQVSKSTLTLTQIDYFLQKISIDDIVVIKDSALVESNNEYDEVYPGYNLKDVLQNIMTQAIPDFSGQIKSKLLFNDEDETGIITNPPYTRLDWNYVTGQLLNNYYLVQNGDFIDPYASNLATDQQANFDEILEAISGIFNADWYIDNDGHLRIEHGVYKGKDVGLSISEETYLLEAYEYDNDEIPNRQTLEFAEARYDDFTQKSIEYNNVPAIQGNEESVSPISIKFLATDVDGINRFLGALQTDGFILVEAASNGEIVSATGRYSGETDLQNANLSIANLLYDYYRYEMFAQTVLINEVETEALSLKKVKTQNDVEFQSSIRPDMDQLITTNIGLGEIQSMEYQCNNGNKYTLKVMYDD